MNHMEEMGMAEQRRWTVPLCDRTVISEVNGDYTLPDYQPEIRRLLWVKPTVLPPAKYIGGGQVELNGSVEYQILYVGADGGLYTAPLSAEYSAAAPMEQMNEVDLGAGVTAFATTVCEGSNTRVVAPRRIAIRSRMRSHIRAFGSMPTEAQISGEADPATIRRLGEETENMTAVSGISEMIPLGEEIGGISEDTRVISADGIVFLNEICPAEGMATGRGELFLKLMVGREDGSVETVLRRLPVEGQVELEGMSADGMCAMTGTVSELTVTVEEGRIRCEIGVLLSARGMNNNRISYTSDLYSTAVESECETRSYRIPLVQKCGNGNLSQSERISVEGLNLPADATVVDAWGTVLFDGCEPSGDGTVLMGQSRYLLLCQKEGEYSVTEVILPLRYKIDGTEKQPTCYDAVGEIISCRARVDGETLSLDAEISLAIDLIADNEIQTVSGVRFGNPLTCRGDRMIVYYPLPEDTAWTVAKRYHISPEKLSEGASYYLI